MSATRIQTTHVGSLVRPPELLTLLRAASQGRPLDPVAFESCLRASVAAVVQQQTKIGIDIVSDGELSKSSWARYINDRLSGIELLPPNEADAKSPSEVRTLGRDRERFSEFYVEYDRTQRYPAPRVGWAISGPITYKGQAALTRDIENFKAVPRGSRSRAGFLAAVAPASVVPEGRDLHYASEEARLFAIAEALREEYRGIVAAGFILQVDDAHLPFMYERMVPPASLRDYRKWARLRVDALNHALQGIPEDRSRYHICWGSWNGPHSADVALANIVDLVLKVRVGGYSIEAANPRHEHEWRVWEDVKLPQGKTLIPGVISHATNVLEHPELVAQRIVRFCRLVGRENVIAGTDCGFSQGPFIPRVHESIQWAKLQSLVEGARLASRELWKKAKPARAKRSAAPKIGRSGAAAKRRARGR